MEESILTTIKKLLGIPSSDTAFDTDIITHINSIFMILQQLGIGNQVAVFSIQDSTAKWSDYLTDQNQYSAVKSYIYLNVRMLFDPPGTSFLQESISRAIAELGWRLMVQVPIP